jgi:hypothetical protein
MKSWLVILAALTLCAGAAHAQDSYLTQSGLNMYGRSSGSGGAAFGSGGGSGSHSLLGILGSGNLKITNEASFSVTSGAGGSLTQGLNVTRLSYAAGGPLSMSVGVGSLFMSSGSYMGYSANPGIYLHDVNVRYQTGEHSAISFQFQRMPGTWDRRYASSDYLRGYGYGYGDGMTEYPFFPR